MKKEKERELKDEVRSKNNEIYEKRGVESTQCSGARNEKSQFGAVGVGRFYRGYVKRRFGFKITSTFLVSKYTGLRHGGVQKVIGALLRNKLISRNSEKYEGYKLTYLGYDFLALRVFVARGVIAGVGRKIGVGKESDIYLVQNDEGTTYALKLHRLGRVSFKSIKTKRDYLQGRHKSNWLYVSRLAAVKEFAFMKALYQNDFSVPIPVDQNRHCVVMELCQGVPLYHIKTLKNAEVVYKVMMDTIVRFVCTLFFSLSSTLRNRLRDDCRYDLPNMV